MRGKKTGGQGMVTVRDRGPGLPPGLEQGEPPAPGELFCREGLPRSGAGLGLCACRRAVGVLGGRFLLSSGKEGAAVSFSLPLDPGGLPPQPPVPPDGGPFRPAFPAVRGEKEEGKSNCPKWLEFSGEKVAASARKPVFSPTIGIE